jgi:hypothetical protein
LNHELGNPVTALQHNWGARIAVVQGDLDLSAVSSIHGSWGIHNGQALLGGEAGTRVDECGVSIGQSDRDTGAHEFALKWSEFHVLGCDEVRAGIARVSVCGDVRGIVEQGYEHFRLVYSHKPLLYRDAELRKSHGNKKLVAET